MSTLKNDLRKLLPRCIQEWKLLTPRPISRAPLEHNSTVSLAKTTKIAKPTLLKRTTNLCTRSQLSRWWCQVKALLSCSNTQRLQQELLSPSSTNHRPRSRRKQARKQAIRWPLGKPSKIKTSSSWLDQAKQWPPPNPRCYTQEELSLTPCRSKAVTKASQMSINTLQSS